jgi:hypothetical protein
MKTAIALALTLVFASTAEADTPASAPQPAPSVPIAATRADPPALGTAASWLELQRSGAHAGQPNALPGEAMERIYKRYLGSFEHPIPQRFPDNDAASQR